MKETPALGGLQIVKGFLHLTKVTGTGFTFLMKQLNKCIKYMKLSCHDIEYQEKRAVTPEKWEIHKMSPVIFPNYFLEKMS